MKARHLSFGFVMFLGGCYGIPDRNLKETVSEQDVLGVWKLTAKSLQTLTRDKFQPDPGHLYTLTFRADGTCTFASAVEGARTSEYLVVEGEWKLEHDIKDSNIKKRNALRMTLLTPSGTLMFDLNFDRDKQRQLILWQFHGDPDQYEFLEYSRSG